MEYRLLAELMRQIRILIPLGGGRPLPRTPALSIYESLTQTWMYWQMRAVARATGIPPVKITSEYLLDCVRYIGGVVGVKDRGQLQFHRVTRQRSRSIALLLNSTAHDLFILSFCFVLIHLSAHLFFFPMIASHPLMLNERSLSCRRCQPLLQRLCGCSSDRTAFSSYWRCCWRSAPRSASGSGLPQSALRASGFLIGT